MVDWGENDRRRSYDAMSDRYLRDYFTLPQVKTQLFKVGLMTKDGKVLSEEEYKRATIRRQQRWAARQQLAHRMAMDARDSHLGRQLELQKQLQAVSRVETYRKMRGESGKQNLVSITPLEVEKTLTRSQSAPSYRAPYSNRSTSIPPLISPENHFNSSGYHTDDDRDRPRSEVPDNEERARQKRALRRRYMKELDRYQFLHKLDNESLESYDAYLRLQLGRLERARLRPFTYAYADDDEITHVLTAVEPDAGLPEIPDRPIDSLYDYRGRSTSNNKPKWRHLQVRTPRGNDGKDGQESAAGNQRSRSRSQSPGKNGWQQPNKATLSRLYVTSAAAPGRRRRQPQASCECFLQYTGPNRIVGEKPNEGQLYSISITQQHCGGNMINVFTGDLMAKGKFQFLSYRQRGFPFSLTFTEDNSTALRISTCCESRYAVGTRLGGKKGIFRWLGVQNAVPCYKCQMYRGLEAPYTNCTNKPIKKKKTSAAHVPTVMTPLSAKPPRPPPKKQSTPKAIKKSSGMSNAKKAALGTAAIAGAAAVGTEAVLAAENGHEENAEEKSHENGEEKSEDETETHHSQQNGHTEMESESGSDSGSESGSESGSGSGSDSEGEEDHSVGTGSRRSSASHEATDDHTHTATATATETATATRHDSENEETDEHGHTEGREDEESENINTSHVEESHQSQSHSHSHTHQSGSQSGSESEEETTHQDAQSHHSVLIHREKGDESGHDESKMEEHEGDGSRMDSTADIQNSEMVEESKIDGDHEAKGDGHGSGTESESESGSEESEEETETKSQSTVKEVRKDEEEDKETGVDRKEENAEVEERSHHKEVPGDKPIEAHEAATESHSTQMHDAGIQPGIPYDNEDSSTESSDSDSSGTDTEEEKTGQPDHTQDHDLTEKLKSASNALLAAENSKIHESETEEENRSPSPNPNPDPIPVPASGLLGHHEMWFCTICNFDNEPDANRCRICGVQRENSQQQNHAVASENHLDTSDHDHGPWTCRICNFDNDSDLHRCRVCGVPRSSSEATEDPNQMPVPDADPEAPVFENLIRDEARIVEEVGRREENKPRVREDDEDTLADAESIRNELSEHHEVNENEGKLKPSGPSISIEPPSSGPSRMSGDEVPVDETIGKGIHVPDHIDPDPDDPDHNENHPTDDESDSGTKRNSEPLETSYAENTTLQNTLASAAHEPVALAVVDHGDHEPAAVDDGPHEVAGDGDGERRDAVSAKLKEACSREDVSINNVELDNAAIHIITEQLKQNPNIRSLSIRNAHLTDDGLASIDGALLALRSPQIKALNFNMNYLTSASMPRLIDMVRRHQIESLLLRGNRIGDEAMASLFTEIQLIYSVNRLDVGENEMTKTSAGALAKLIASTQTLEALSLGGSSKFDVDDWRSISRGFMVNQSLETINLDYCQMGDEAVEIVCGALRNNQNLTSIDLDGNNLTDRGAAAVLDLVDHLPNLTNVVWMAGNQVSANAASLVRQILSSRM